jgi:hypothetical protein
VHGSTATEPIILSDAVFMHRKWGICQLYKVAIMFTPTGASSMAVITEVLLSAEACCSSLQASVSGSHATKLT